MVHKLQAQFTIISTAATIVNAPAFRSVGNLINLFTKFSANYCIPTFWQFNHMSCIDDPKRLSLAFALAVTIDPSDPMQSVARKGECSLFAVLNRMLPQVCILCYAKPNLEHAIQNILTKPDDAADLPANTPSSGGRRSDFPRCLRQSLARCWRV